MKNNRVIPLILPFTLVLSIGIISKSWSATDCPAGQTCTKCGDDCWAYLTGSGNNKTLNIIGTGAMYDYVPNDSGSTPWTKCGATSVVIEKGITSIGQAAFRSMNSVKSISIPDTIASIGDSALSRMTGITGELVLPYSLTSIGNNAFSEMTGVTNIKIPDSVATLGKAFKDTGNGFIIVSDSVTSLDSYTFYNASLKGLVVGSSVTNISPSTFYAMNGSIFCPQGLNCDNKGQTGKTMYYTKDENGVYKVGDIYYASAEDMSHIDSEGALSPIACESYAACVKAAGVYKEEKAEKMALNGILCQTKLGCLKLFDMVAGDDYQCDTNGIHMNNIANCSSYAKANGIALNICPGEQVYYQRQCLDEYPFAKKHYTPAEAAQWLNEDNNTITLTFKK